MRISLLALPGELNAPDMGFGGAPSGMARTMLAQGKPCRVRGRRRGQGAGSGENCLLLSIFTVPWWELQETRRNSRPSLCMQTVNRLPWEIEEETNSFLRLTFSLHYRFWRQNLEVLARTVLVRVLARS